MTSSSPAKTEAVANRGIRRGTARFQKMNQRPNADRKTKSTLDENGGEAITTIVSATQPRTFRATRSHLLVMYGEIVIAKRSKPAPEKRDSPEAKYSATGFIAEMVSGGKYSP